MLIRPLSDLHNEFATYTIPHLDTDKDTILTLAGDIHVKKHLFGWLLRLKGRFKAVVLILGNHDYWQRDYHKIFHELNTLKQLHKFTELHILNCESVTIDGFTIYGGTMWTDYKKGDPLTMMQTGMMWDYKKIRTNFYGRRFTPKFAIGEHIRFKNELINLLQSTTGDIMVMSHHGPTELSGDTDYIGDASWWFYVSDLSNLILDNPRIKLWQHGHIHQTKDYLMGDTRVICNPLGYAPSDLVKDFKPNLVIDL